MVLFAVLEERKAAIVDGGRVLVAVRGLRHGRSGGIVGRRHRLDGYNVSARSAIARGHGIG